MGFSSLDRPSTYKKDNCSSLVDDNKTLFLYDTSATGDCQAETGRDKASGSLKVVLQFGIPRISTNPRPRADKTLLSL
jgi:hypothetical protein